MKMRVAKPTITQALEAKPRLSRLSLRPARNSGLPNASPYKGTQASVAFLRSFFSSGAKGTYDRPLRFRQYGSSVYIVPFRLRRRAFAVRKK